jgi:hypothetical protein
VTPAVPRAWGWFKRVAPWALAALVLGLVARQARTVDWPAVWQALQSLSAAHMAAAALLALVSYGLYAAFDLIGRRLTGHSLSVARTLGTAAISYAINLNFGAWVGGLGLRLRLYSRWGLAVPSVLQVVAYSMVTNWLGYLWVAGAVLLWAPPQLPAPWLAWMMPGAGLRAIGLAMVSAAHLLPAAAGVGAPRLRAERGGGAARRAGTPAGCGSLNSAAPASASARARSHPACPASASQVDQSAGDPHHQAGQLLVGQRSRVRCRTAALAAKVSNAPSSPVCITVNSSASAAGTARRRGRGAAPTTRTASR